MHINTDEKESSPGKNPHSFGVILAGGDGTRLKSLSERIYGYYRPKQFCALMGTKSLLRQTITRAQMLIPFDQIFTVVTKHHCNFYQEELVDLPLRTILVQPCPRGTSAAIVFALLKIYNIDPEAIVTIFPSDHFINDEEKFMKYVEEANSFSEMDPNVIVMLGIKPEEIETGYGWIEGGDLVNANNIYYVNKFWEKPTAAQINQLLQYKIFLNTFVLVGKCSTFIENINKYIPEVINAFEPINRYLDSGFEKYIIESTYRTIPDLNFSEHVLQKMFKDLRVMEIPDVYWSDWGEESRVIRDVKRFSQISSGIKDIKQINQYFSVA